MNHKFLLFFLFFLAISFVSAEYSVTIFADNVTGGTADVEITDLGNSSWKINGTNGDYEIDRALVMKWLFYGTNGANARITPTYITNFSSIASNDIRDIGRRGFYMTMGTVFSQSGTYTGTLTNTVNNTNLSSWSYVSFHRESSGGAAENYWRVDGFNINGGSNSDGTPPFDFLSDETGTNRVADQDDNPSTVQIISASISNALDVATIRAYFLSRGNVTYGTSGSGTRSNINFYDQYSISSFSGITINSPSNGSNSFINTQKDFNITAEDENGLSNVTFYFNGVAVQSSSLSGNLNTSIISYTPTVSGIIPYYFTVCNTLNDCYNSETRYLNVNNYEIISLSYPSSFFNGDIITTSMLINLSTGISFNEVNVVLNNVPYSVSVIQTEGNQYSVSKIFTATGFSSDIEFYFNFTLSNAESGQSDTNNLSLTTFNLDNCSTYTFPLLNLSLFNEVTKAPINGTIEILFEVLNVPNYQVIDTLNYSIDSVTETTVCADTNFSTDNVAYNAEIRYLSDGYEAELYNIQRADLDGTADVIELYDLSNNDSTEFSINYKNSDFVLVEGAVIQLRRKYIGEGIYRVVEAPVTSSDGTTVLHIDLNSILYDVVVLKDGVVLDTFVNVDFNCQNELSGSCSKNLVSSLNPLNDLPLTTINDFEYAISSSGNTISVLFSIPSGETASINLQLQQVDMFGNESLCNKTVLSSGGTIECTFNNNTIADSYLYLNLYKDGVPQAFKTYFIETSDNLDFLDNNFIIMFIMVLSLTGMAFSSPEFIIVNGVITMLISGMLYLANGLNFVIGLGSLFYLVIAAGIFISKLSKQEDQ